MSEPVGRDPLDELRRSNPVDADQLPSASLARMRARVQEKTMVGTTQPARRSRAVAPLLAGTALAALGLVALIGSGALAPAVSPGMGSASCVEQYSLDTLKNRSYAFDGTVSAIDGDEVTFKLNQVFRGDTPGSLTLTAAGMTGTSITSAGGPNLTVGDRYLVAGDDHFVWACGFTQAYDASVAAQWSAALAG